MADLIISKKETTPQSLAVTSESEKLTIEPAGSVIVDLTGEYGSGTDTAYAVQLWAQSETDNNNIITLNGPISITDKTTDPGESTSHYTCGLLVANTATSGTKETYTATIKTNNASTIDVTRDTTTSQSDVITSGIRAENSKSNLVFGDGNGKFLDAITVTATNSNKTNGTNIFAYGISSYSTITFNDELAAAINVTATQNTTSNEYKRKATAQGIGGSSQEITLKKGISSAITATATSNTSSGTASAIKSSKTLVIGTKDAEADLAGAITVKATGASGITIAQGLVSSAISIYGNITENITATASGKNSGQAYAYGLKSSSSGAVNITGTIAGAIKATATAKANTAEAYGLIGGTAATISKGITKDITATATGAATTEAAATTKAYGITLYNNGAVTIGGTETDTALAGAITATATANATLADDKETGYAGHANAAAINGGTVSINGGITKAITATAMANSVTQSDKTVVGGTAYAYGLNASQTVNITGALAGAIKATATAKANAAEAYGINGGTVTVTEGITKDITATANGAATASLLTENRAYGIYSTGAVTIGETATDTALAGAITAKATGNATLTGGTAYAGNANAYAIYAYNDNYANGKVTINGDITKAITATATANSVTQSDKTAVGGTASASGIYTSGAVSITGALAGEIKATATATAKAGSACAYGINAKSDDYSPVTISDGITKAITVTATGAARTMAYGIYSGKALTIGADLAGAITIKATNTTAQAAAGSDAIGLIGDTVKINGNITKAITVTATSNSVKQADGTSASATASAYGIYSGYATDSEGISITGAVNAAIKVTATGKSNTATAYGIIVQQRSKAMSIAKGITKDITVTATGTAKTSGSTTSKAYGIATNSGAVTIGDTSEDVTNLAGAITAKATGSAKLNADKTVGYAGNAEADAIKGSTVTINGNVTKAITATATANSVTQKDGTVVGGTAYAYGINASGAVSITGALAGDITATATAEANTATATGIYAEGNVDLTGAVSGVISATATSGTTYAYAFGIDGEGSALNAGSDLGTIRVSAAGVGDDVVAFGIYGKNGNSLTYTGDRLTANVAVKSSSLAYGISVDSITKKDGTTGVAKLNVSVTGNASADGIALKDEADLTLQESSITAHASQATSLFSTGDTAQKITLEKSTLAGNVSLDSGNDTLTLKGSSMITGDVDMGDGTDTLSVSSGSRITGDITGAESTTLVLDDLSYASSVLWEGAEIGLNLTLDFSSDMLKGVTTDGVTFNLLKDTDSEWSETSAILFVDGSSTAKTLEQGTAVEYGDFKYLLSTSTDEKTLTVTVTRTGGTAEDPGIVTDTDKPTITVDTSASTFKQGDTLWFQQGAVATVKGTDATSGVHYLTRTGGDGKYNISGDTATLDLELELDEAATVSYTAVDKAGNVSDAATVKYNVDGSEPTITGTAVSGATEVDGVYWVKQGDTATVGANVTDAKSGVKEVTFDGEAVTGTEGAYSKTYDTSTEHDLTGYTLAATDNVGNAASETLQIGVDGTPVEISFSTAGTDSYADETNVWVKTGATFSLAAAFSDALSGVNTDSVKLNGETIALGAGDEYTEIITLESGSELEWKLSAEDNAGNTLEKTVRICIDETAPDVSKAAITGDTVSGQWVKAGAAFTVDMTAADTQSGVAGTTLDDVKYEGRTFEVTAGTEESEIVEHELSAVDNVGNESGKGSISYGIDGTGPVIGTITVSNSCQSGENAYWVKQGATVTVNATVTDAKSGVKEVTFDGTASTGTGDVYTASYDTATEKVQSAYVIAAADKVGNEAESKTLQIGVDGTGPTLTVTRAPETGIGAQDTITVTATATDAGSGFDKITYTIDGGEAQTYTQALSITENCTISFTAYDKVGNTSTDQIVIGDFAPQVTVLSEAKWFKNGDTVTITGTVKDGSHKGITGMAVTGAEGTVSYEQSTTQYVYNWSYTYNGADTKGTTLTFSATDANNKTGTADYTLTVDTVAPEITFSGVEPQYATSEGLHWYKATDDISFITATAADETSGVKSIKVYGVEKDNPASVALDLRNETESALTVTFNAIDNAGNVEADRVFKFEVDGTAPEIGNAVFTGDTLYFDEEAGKAWFKLGDATAALQVAITDQKSGLDLDANKTHYLSTSSQYADGKFALETGIAVGAASGYIVATDNVGYETQSAAKYVYGVDGTGPSITVTQDPAKEIWTDVVTVTAAFSDGEGSGVAAQQYAINGGVFQDYTTPFTVDSNCTITFKAVDNVGNETVQDYQVTNIDTQPPVVTIDADTITVQENVTFTVSAEDACTNVTSLEYSIDNGTTWTACTITQGKSVTVDMTATVNKTTYLFRAFDQANNESEWQSVTFNNIYKGTEESCEIIGLKDVTPDLPVVADKVTMTENSIMAVEEDASVTAEVLTMSGNDKISNNGSVTTDTLSVSGTDNVISGELIEADTITLAEGAELGLDKDQYDSFMTGADFATADGKLIVSESTGNALRTGDIDTLMNKTNVSDVEFEQNLIDVNKLNVKSAKEAVIDFQDAYGTTRSDTIRFYKDTNLTFGSEGGKINLEEGSNTVQIDKNATTAILSNLVNVSKVTAASGSTVTLADVDFQTGRNASLKAEGTSFTAGTINGTDKNTTVTIGKNTAFESDAITLADKGDKITANSGSTVYVGSSEGDVFTGAELDFNDGNDTLNAKGSNFVAGTVNFGEGNDTLTTGTGSVFAAIASKNGDWATTTDVQYADISFGDGNDKLSVGKSSAFAASAVNDADTISLGAYSTMQVVSINGTKKLTISNGKEGQIATLKASAVTGTAENDSYNLGNWNDVDFASLDFGDGNDTLKIGSYADVDISSLDFGEGTKDKLTIGKGATLSVNKLDVDSLDTLSMSKDSFLVIADAEDLAAAQEKWSKYSGQIVSKLA